MKKITALILTILLAFSLTACGDKASKEWQQQYDMGMKYLSEMDYENAILAFEAAIKIDPKQATSYIALAKTYKGRDNFEKVKEILYLGLDNATDKKEILDAYEDVFGKPLETTTERVEQSDGTYLLNEYTEDKKWIKMSLYGEDNKLKVYGIMGYDRNRKLANASAYTTDGKYIGYAVFETDEKGKVTRADGYVFDKLIGYAAFEYGKGNKATSWKLYNTKDEEITLDSLKLW